MNTQETKTKANTVNTAKKESEEKMQTQETKQNITLNEQAKEQLKQNIKTEEHKQVKSSLLTTVRKIKQAGNFEEVFNSLQTLDLENYKNGKQTNKAKSFLECWLYDEFINNNESTTKTIHIEFMNFKTLKNITQHIPFITGICDFEISGKKVNWTTADGAELVVTLKQPYNSYKESLELYGLTFTADKKEEQQQISNEQQNAINEANSILQAYGLNAFEI